MLKISVPTIVVCPYDGNRVNRISVFYSNGKAGEDIFRVSLMGLNRMLYGLAHGLRLNWQERKGRGLFSGIKNPSEFNSFAEFALQPEAIDAEAFAILYLKSIGITNAEMLSLPATDETKSPESRLGCQMILKRMKEIEKELS